MVGQASSSSRKFGECRDGSTRREGGCSRQVVHPSPPTHGDPDEILERQIIRIDVQIGAHRRQFGAKAGVVRRQHGPRPERLASLGRVEKQPNLIDQRPMCFDVLTGDVRHESLVAIGLDVQHEAALLRLRRVTEALGAEEQPEFQRHVEARQGSRIQFCARNVVDAKRTVLDQLLDLRDPGAARVDRLQGAAWPEAAAQNGEDDCVKKGEIGAIERAVDEDRLPRGQGSARLRGGLPALGRAHRPVQLAQCETLRLEIRARNQETVFGATEEAARHRRELGPIAGPLGSGLCHDDNIGQIELMLKALAG